MSRQKVSKNKRLTETEIELYCKGVEGILTQIRERCSHKKSNKTKKDKNLSENEILTHT